MININSSLKTPEARLTDINTNEALYYLGYKGGDIPDDIAASIEKAKAEVMKAAVPRGVMRVFDVTAGCEESRGERSGEKFGELSKDGIAENEDSRESNVQNAEFAELNSRGGRQPDGLGFELKGGDVQKLLKECGKVILFAVTLGSGIDMLIKRRSRTDMAEAVIIDSCASTAIENVCDNFCADLAAEAAPYFLTDRFSPGYGDLPFEQQTDFCRALDIERRIGVTLTPGGLMLPQKSVTAIVGIADTEQRMRFRGCAYCSSFKNCSYRKNGQSCGRQ